MRATIATIGEASRLNQSHRPSRYRRRDCELTFSTVAPRGNQDGNGLISNSSSTASAGTEGPLESEHSIREDMGQRQALLMLSRRRKPSYEKY